MVSILFHIELYSNHCLHVHLIGFLWILFEWMTLHHTLCFFQGFVPKPSSLCFFHKTSKHLVKPTLDKILPVVQQLPLVWLNSKIKSQCSLKIWRTSRWFQPQPPEMFNTFRFLMWASVIWFMEEGKFFGLMVMSSLTGQFLNGVIQVNPTFSKELGLRKGIFITHRKKI